MGVPQQSCDPYSGGDIKHVTSDYWAGYCRLLGNYCRLTDRLFSYQHRQGPANTWALLHVNSNKKAVYMCMCVDSCVDTVTALKCLGLFSFVMRSCTVMVTVALCVLDIACDNLPN